MVIVVFLVMTVSLPVELALSSDRYLNSDGEEHLETSVTVRHQDEFGNDLLPPYLTSRSQPGTLYIAVDQSGQLPNYDFIATIGHPLGFHEEEDIEVIFVYRHRPTLTITPHQSSVQLGNVVTYTITITNNAADMIEDGYTVRVQFDQVFSSLQQAEFILDYLATGETLIHFGAMIGPDEGIGNKSVIATLIHPDHVNGVDSQVTTQIEITHAVPENSMTELPHEDNETDRQRGIDHLEGEKVATDVEESPTKPTITMFGTFAYDVSIVGTIGIKMMQLFLKS